MNFTRSINLRLAFRFSNVFMTTQSTLLIHRNNIIKEGGYAFILYMGHQTDLWCTHISPPSHAHCHTRMHACTHTHVHAPVKCQYTALQMVDFLPMAVCPVGDFKNLDVCQFATWELSVLKVWLLWVKKKELYIALQVEPPELLLTGVGKC